VSGKEDETDYTKQMSGLDFSLSTFKTKRNEFRTEEN
jgi:hypothetical protein